MLDRVTGMQVFFRAAAEGSFAAAARTLGMSQTMATKHITALEQRLGTRLFHRSTRRLSLTEAGRRFHDACARILPEIEEAELAVSVEQADARGLLRLNAPVSFGTLHVAPLLAEFAALHPRVTVQLGLNDRLVDVVEEGWDLTLRIGRLRDSPLVGRRIAASRLIVCAAPAYLARRGTPHRVADLGAHCCLGYTLTSSTIAATGPDRWLFGRDGEVGVAVFGTLRANNGDALREAAIAGQGIIYQPAFLLADALRDGRLLALLLDHPPLAPIGIHVLHAAAPFVPAKVHAMSGFLTARFLGTPPWEAGLPEPAG